MVVCAKVICFAIFRLHKLGNYLQAEAQVAITRSLRTTHCGNYTSLHQFYGCKGRKLLVSLLLTAMATFCCGMETFLVDLIEKYAYIIF